MEQNQTNWYDKTWLVIILCIFFFPVGLYALWMNSSISKGWKIGVTAFFILGIISQIGTDKTDDTTSDKSDNVVAQSTTSEPEEQAPPKAVENPIQQDFLEKKSDLFFNSVINPANSATTTMFKSNTEQLTQEFLSENNNTTF